MPKNNDMSRVKKKQNSQKKKPTGRKKKKSGMLKKVFFGFILIIGLLLITGGGVFAYYAASAPEITEEDLAGTASSDLLDSQGNVYYSLGGENRDMVTANEVPQILEDAIISIEDQRFYNHIGVDPIRIAGAVVANVTDGFASEGGSTITQQLVKLSVFSTKEEDQTLKRKAQEAWLSVQLERQLSKEQILTHYINKVYMSESLYGMGTASEYYYGKPLNEISLSQAALLAGMPQSPNNYNPYTNPENATNRRDLVLYMMTENGKITEQEAQEAMSVPVTEGLVDHSGEETNNLVIDAYIQEVIDEVEEKTGIDPRTDDLTIYTNIDMEAQQRLYDILNSDEYVAFPNDEIQAGVSMVDVKTGQVKALGGGRKRETQLAFNWAAEGDRNTGSTIKPLTVYGPAIEYLGYSTYEQVVDEPINYESGEPVRNYDREYEGQISMRRSLTDSRNVPTYKIFQEVGYDNASEFLRNLGINPGELNSGANGLVESNAINGTLTPLEMSAAYAAFANGGEYIEPYTVSKVVFPDGQEVDLTPASNRAMSEATAYMITDMLKDVAGTYSSTVGIPGLPQAGKTGTTNYSEKDRETYNIPEGVVPDSWYSGYSTNYSISVWVGYEKQYEEGNWLSNNDEYQTRQLPRKIYRELMAYASESVEASDWSKPSSVLEVAVEAGTDPAQLPGPNTPDSAIVTELFVEGTEPQAISDGFGQTPEQPSGLSAAYNPGDRTISIQWDPYVTNSVVENLSYILTIDGQTREVTETNHIISNPDPGSVLVEVAVQASGLTGPVASTTVTVPSLETDGNTAGDESPSGAGDESVEEETETDGTGNQNNGNGGSESTNPGSTENGNSPGNSNTGENGNDAGSSQEESSLEEDSNGGSEEEPNEEEPDEEEPDEEEPDESSTVVPGGSENPSPPSGEGETGNGGNTGNPDSSNPNEGNGEESLSVPPAQNESNSNQENSASPDPNDVPDEQSQESTSSEQSDTADEQSQETPAVEGESETTEQVEEPETNEANQPSGEPSSEVDSTEQPSNTPVPEGDTEQNTENENSTDTETNENSTVSTRIRVPVMAMTVSDTLPLEVEKFIFISFMVIGIQLISKIMKNRWNKFINGSNELDSLLLT